VSDAEPEGRRDLLVVLDEDELRPVTGLKNSSGHVQVVPVDVHLEHEHVLWRLRLLEDGDDVVGCREADVNLHVVLRVIAAQGVDLLWRALYGEPGPSRLLEEVPRLVEVDPIVRADVCDEAVRRLGQHRLAHRCRPALEQRLRHGQHHCGGVGDAVRGVARRSAGRGGSQQCCHERQERTGRHW